MPTEISFAEAPLESCSSPSFCLILVCRELMESVTPASGPSFTMTSTKDNPFGMHLQRQNQFQMNPLKYLSSSKTA